MQHSSHEYNASASAKVGPRAKCDQVVYEAIAKATEIIVRGRCECNNSNGSGNGGSESIGMNSQTHMNTRNQGQGNHGGGGGGTTSSSSGSTSRFHLEVEEVPIVRGTLQMWRRSLHVPLRLDVYYEYCTDPSQPEQTTRKELLERWCIDYTPSQQQQYSQYHQQPHQSHQPYSSTSSQHRQPQYDARGGGGGGAHQHHPNQHRDDTIAQLRLVVKRVVIMLRILHCQTRLMPAYRLHHALMEDLQHFNKSLGSGPGLSGGYYNTEGQRPRGQDSGSSVPGHSVPWMRKMVGGRINFSFYISESVSVSPSDGRASDVTATLFSSSTNSPFSRHDMTPIPTPFGLLNLTVLYDESLSVERVLADRARRIMSLNVGQNMHTPPVQGREVNARLDHNGQTIHNGTSIPTSRARAIPINIGNRTLARSQSPFHADEHHATSSQQRYFENSGMDQHQQSFENHQHDPNQDYSPNAGSALNHSPSPSPSLKVVSEHFVQNNAESMERPKSADPSHHYIRDRLGSDPGRGFINNEKRALSGLSLALMNEEMREQGNDTQNVEKDSKSSSPLIRPSLSNDGANASSLKQRMAFHHPPPSFDDQAATQGQASSSYGYGYNNGNSNVLPPASILKLGSVSSQGGSPSPMTMINTPPQPMFIGSLPRSLGVGPGISKVLPDRSVNNPPFQNPTALQEAPSNDASSIGHVNNSIPIPGSNVSSQQQSNTIGNTIMNTTLLPPINSLDALASSPFKTSVSQSMATGVGGGTTSKRESISASAFSSLVLGRGSAAYGPLDEGFPLALPSGGSALIPGRSGGDFLARSGHGYFKQTNFSEDVTEDMPFVVEIESSFAGGGISNTSTPKMSRQNSALDMSAVSSGTMSSQVVSSLAHRCSTAGRLKMFSKEQGEKKVEESSLRGGKSIMEEDIANLTNQLDDFRSFGESITFSK